MVGNMSRKTLLFTTTLTIQIGKILQDTQLPIRVHPLIKKEVINPLITKNSFKQNFNTMSLARI